MRAPASAGLPSPPFGSYRCLIAELGQSGKVFRVKSSPASGLLGTAEAPYIS